MVEGTLTRPSATGHSGAIVVRVETTHGPMAVRGWPEADLPTERIEGLHRLLAHVHASGFEEVAVPRQTPVGPTLVRVDDRSWQVEPWMPGRPDLRTDPTSERMAAAAVCLARWHAAARSFEAPPDVAEWFGRSTGISPAVVERLRRIERWNSGAIDIAERLAEKDETPFGQLARKIVAHFRRRVDDVQAELETFARNRLPLLPCLRDVHAEHVLYERERVSGLIDPSACRSDTVAVDLARLFGDAIGGDPSVNFDPAWESALDAYDRVGTLTVVERRLVRVLDRSAVLLMGLTWLDRCYFMQRPVAFDTRVLARLRRLVARFGSRFEVD